MAFDLCKLLSPLLFAALLLSPFVHAKEISYCDKNGKYEVKVNGVDMSPDPMVRGKPVTFSISASTGPQNTASDIGILLGDKLQNKKGKKNCWLQLACTKYQVLQHKDLQLGLGTFMLLICCTLITNKVITGGKLVIDVSYFGMHVHSESHDLCKETSCPLSIGDFLLSHTQTLPGYTPPGSYILKMKMLGENGDRLTCISFDFKIGLSSPFEDS